MGWLSLVSEKWDKAADALKGVRDSAKGVSIDKADLRRGTNWISKKNNLDLILKILTNDTN
jgi:hypothetical protein